MNNTGRKGCSNACERCRKSKTRCSAETLEEHGKCRRCYLADAECHFPPATGTQRRRRRTDARVATLEKRLDALKSVLAANQASELFLPPSVTHNSHDIGNQLNVNYGNNTSQSPLATHARHVSGSSRISHTAQTSLEGHDPIPGYLDASLLTYSAAADLYSEFKARVIDGYPVVVVPHHESFHSHRLSQPFLVYAMITAAARGKLPHLFETLHVRLQKTIIKEAILNGQKSLELIQAILVLEIWYCTPQDLSRLNFCQWIHLAATMALHTGLVGAGKSYRGKDGDASTIKTRQLDWWRTELAIHISASAVAISLHRQAIFTVGKNAQACLNGIATNSKLLNDKRLVSWATLQQIAEAVESLQIQSSAISTAQDDLIHLETQFDSWKQSLYPGVLNTSLEIHYLYCRCKLYEKAVLYNQCRVVQNPTNLSTELNTEVSHLNRPVAFAPPLIKAILSVVQYCHMLLDTFCQIESSLYLHQPTVTTIRALYALNTLSTLRQLSKTRHHVIGSIIDHDTIRLDVYIERLKAFLGKILSLNHDFRVPELMLNRLDTIANQPLLSHHRPSESTPTGGSVEDQNDHSTACNDFEAVIVTSVSPDDELINQRASSSNTLQASVTTIQPDISESTRMTSPIFEKMIEIGNKISYGDMDIGGVGYSDMDLMCMPDLMMNADPWFDIGCDGFQESTGFLYSGSSTSNWHSGPP